MRKYIEYKRKYIDLTNVRKRLLKARSSVFYSNFPVSIECLYAVIKGEALSLLAYGKCGQRVSQDIDILVPKHSLEVIENEFFTKGFEKIDCNRIDSIYTIVTSHQTIPLMKKIDPFGHMLIDLNFDVFWGEYEGEKIDIERFLSDCIEVELYGVKVKTLPPLKTMIQLILHHYKDMNSIFLLATRHSINYAMFQDIYFLLLNNQEEITVSKLFNISEEYQIIPYVYYILYYTFQIFNDPTLKPYLSAFHTFEGDRLLPCYGLCSKERKEWKVDFITRLRADNLYQLIKDDLTEKDVEKISINKNFF